MRASMRADLKAAIKTRDRVAISALRSALSAIDNAEAVPTEEASPSGAASEHVAVAAVGLGATEATRRELTDADLRSILEQEVRERSAAAAEYEQLGRDELAAQLRSEADVLNRYLSQAG